MIEFNYQSAISQAKALENASQELKNLITLLKNQRTELQAAWKGEAADLFMKKTDELFKDMNKTAKTAAGIATGVGTAAKAIKAAEEAAKKLAETVTR